MATSRPSLLLFLPLTAALLIGCGDSTDNPPGSGGSGGGAGAGGTAGAGGAGGQGGGSTGTIPVESLTETIAKTYCDALFRCCTGADMKYAFAEYAGQPAIESQSGTIPPAKTLTDAAECAANLKPLLDIVPYGDYIAQVSAGNVTYDPAAAFACKEALDKAACGAEIANALRDPTCFALVPSAFTPRSMFQGKNAVGEPCLEIRDGTINRERGTCDPMLGFCCVDNGSGDCAFPSIGSNQPPQEGTCKAVSAEGESCSVSPTIQLCKQGLTCDLNMKICTADKNSTPLKNGDTCFDMMQFEFTGSCQEGYCDYMGTATCVPFKSSGQSCSGPHECSSFRCDNSTCVAFCETM